MIETFIIGVLTVILLAQNIFWAKVVYDLTNRLMSRNYAEFMQAKGKPTKLASVPEEEHDPIAERQAKELNSILGMV